MWHLLCFLANVPREGVLKGIGTGCEEEGTGWEKRWAGPGQARGGEGTGLCPGSLGGPLGPTCSLGRPGAEGQAHNGRAAAHAPAAGSLHAVVLNKTVSPQRARRKLPHAAMAGR